MVCFICISCEFIHFIYHLIYHVFIYHVDLLYSSKENSVFDYIDYYMCVLFEIFRFLFQCHS